MGEWGGIDGRLGKERGRNGRRIMRRSGEVEGKWGKYRCGSLEGVKGRDGRGS